VHQPIKSTSVNTKPTDGGAAIQRMREIAMSIYESTPGI